MRGRGTGHELLRDVLHEAARQRVSPIRLRVHKANARARRPYERFGFYEVAEISQQRRADSIEMELRPAGQKTLAATEP